MTHDLDGWHDGRAADGSVCLGQPLVRTFYSSRTLSEILALLQGDLDPSGRAELRKTWQSLDESAWRQALERGFLPDSELPPVKVDARPLAWGAPPAAAAATRGKTASSSAFQVWTSPTTRPPSPITAIFTVVFPTSTTANITHLPMVK